jgi:steroid 5-alpha reductase family enzyme
MLRAFLWVKVAYLVALAVAWAVALAVGAGAPIAAAAWADVAGTLAIFAFSMAFGNSSFYDPYWSVAPPWIALWFVAVGPDDAATSRQGLVLALVFAWALRLTWNWARGWSGLAHEDWRYVDLRTSSPLPYWLTSLLGIHLFPTLQVFLGCLALWPALASARPLGPLDALALVVTAGAIALEPLADEQLRAFRRRAAPCEICADGVWAWLRHPNYLGELLFWWGLWLFALAADPAWWWSGVGALAITLMFVFASVPMLDRRSLARRPGYAEVCRRVPALVPRRPRV